MLELKKIICVAQKFSIVNLRVYFVSWRTRKKKKKDQKEKRERERER